MARRPPDAVTIIVSEEHMGKKVVAVPASFPDILTKLARELARRSQIPEPELELSREVENAEGSLGSPALRLNPEYLYFKVLARFGVEALVFILLHELGHTADSSPQSHGSVGGRWRHELFADQFAARTMRELGLPLGRTLEFLKDHYACGFDLSHPPYERRVEAIRAEYGIISNLIDRLRDLTR